MIMVPTAAAGSFDFTSSPTNSSSSPSSSTDHSSKHIDPAESLADSEIDLDRRGAAAVNRGKAGTSPIGLTKERPKVKALDSKCSISDSISNKDSSSSNSSLVSSVPQNISSQQSTVNTTQSNQRSSSVTISQTISSSSSSSLPAGSQAAETKDSSSQRRYSRTHQRRFHRRFPAVDPHEKLIDWYSCALIADILLQGYLYISENYFAFYSNILGYKTQLLIPICDVISVTKEKTAKIFPNAVGICTDQTKYVFGSLLSREATFRLMQEVWKSTLIQVVSMPYFSPVIPFDTMKNCERAILSEKPGEEAEEEEDNEEEEEDIETNTTTTTSIGNVTLSLAVKQPTPLLFANIKPHPETIKLVSSELTPIQQIFSSSQETDSSGSDSETNRGLSEESCQQQQDSNKNTHKISSVGYGSRLIQRTKDWLFTLIRPHHQTLWNQVSGTTRLLILATTVLIMLFLSALIFLYRVEQAHSKFLSLQQQHTDINDPNQVQLKQLELRKEIKRLVTLLEEKAAEMTILKSRMEDMLDSFQRLPTCS